MLLYESFGYQKFNNVYNACLGCYELENQIWYPMILDSGKSSKINAV